MSFLDRQGITLLILQQQTCDIENHIVLSGASSSPFLVATNRAGTPRQKYGTRGFPIDG
jgi:hypothetical protein